MCRANNFSTWLSARAIHRCTVLNIWAIAWAFADFEAKKVIQKPESKIVGSLWALWRA